MCALFCVLGGMYLNNRAFQKKSTRARAKKLDVVLRQLTDGALTEGQRQQLGRVLGEQHQYKLQLFTSWCDFNLAAAQAQAQDKMLMHILPGGTGSPNHTPSAILARGQSHGKSKNTVYIYLPKLKEAMRDETRTKEAKEA